MPNKLVFISNPSWLIKYICIEKEKDTVKGYKKV